MFIHIGERLPSYIEIALAQARLFNPACELVLIANEQALDGFYSEARPFLVPCESLPMTLEHQTFCKRTKLNSEIQDGYWLYTSERFLYLYDYMVAFEASNVFHIENDVLLYADLTELLPVFQECYSGIATTFESEFKCIPGFVFVPHRQVMQKLARYFAAKASKAVPDMKVLAWFWKEHPTDIDCLPMVMESYLITNTPPSFENRLLNSKRRHCKHIEAFGSLFDGAAIGVFFDGIEQAKGNFPPGYRMKTLFDPLLIDYEWIVDENGRKVPYAKYGAEMYRINNLHIASKRLQKFASKSAGY